MNKRFSRLTALISAGVLTAFVSGCASVAVTGDAIETNTAHALGVDKGTFTISDRVDEGVKTTYNVKTNAGKRYSCYVTVKVSVMGRIVSDAMCNEIKSGKQASGSAGAAAGAAPACNALLKAAGKCS